MVSDQKVKTNILFSFMANDDNYLLTALQKSFQKIFHSRTSIILAIFHKKQS